jgi:hypothetical protein
MEHVYRIMYREESVNDGAEVGRSSLACEASDLGSGERKIPGKAGMVRPSGHQCGHDCLGSAIMAKRPIRCALGFSQLAKLPIGSP